MYSHKWPVDLSPYKVVCTTMNVYTRQHDNTRAHGQSGKINSHISLFFPPPPHFLLLSFSVAYGYKMQIAISISLDCKLEWHSKAQQSPLNQSNLIQYQIR